MSNSCVWCSHIVSSGLRVFAQVHIHGTRVPCFIKQFVHFDAERFSFLLNILPKDNCQILRGVIEFSVSVVQGIKDGP